MSLYVIRLFVWAGSLDVNLKGGQEMKKKFLVGLAVSICIIIGGIANATVIENFDDGDISNYSFISAANGAGDLPSVTSTASHDGPFGLEVGMNGGCIEMTWLYNFLKEMYSLHG
jgi:hypothetical protein